MNETLISLQSISLSIAGRNILNNVSVDVRAGEFFSLLGPSGCGKTTLLRIIAGFLHPSAGQLVWAGQNITQVPAQKRDLNLVFQNYALFPHLTVFENVAFGLRMQKLPQKLIESRTMESLSLVRMNQFAQRPVTELSGGQQQRIALARAIAPRPKLVLLDEPLGALDLQLRKDMQWELKTLQRQLGMTFLYVTHDQEEAFAMSDRIALLNGGKLEQVATPEQLYLNPASRFVAEFIGTANFLPAERVSSHMARCLNSKLEYALQTGESAPGNTQFPINGTLLVRPEEIKLHQAHTTSNRALTGVVQMRQYLGAVSRYHVEIQGSQKNLLTVDLPSTGHQFFSPGETVDVTISSPQLTFFSTGLPT